MSNVSAPSSSQPIQRWRSRNRDAERLEPAQPRAQQRRGLERLRKHAAAGADEGLLPKLLAPVAQALGRKRIDCRGEMRRGFAVAREEMPAGVRCASGSARRARPSGTCGRPTASVVHASRAHRLRDRLRRHQPGGSGADHRDVGEHRRGSSRRLQLDRRAAPPPARHICCVCWNASSSACALLMSLISPKCAAMASGVHSSSRQIDAFALQDS